MIDDKPVFSAGSHVEFFEKGFSNPPRMAHTLCNECAVINDALCSSLDNEMFLKLNSLRVEKTVVANQVLFEEGDDKRFVYTLREGMLRLFSVLPDGRRQISVFVMPGDYVGLIDTPVYTQTAEAVIPSKLCSFRKDALNDLMAEYPELHRRLLCKTSRSLRYSRERQFLLGRMTPLEKLANFIILHARQLGLKDLTDNPVPIAMSRADIADYLGITIETVSRNFSRLKTQGIIRFNGTGLVHIVNRKALFLIARLCDDDCQTPDGGTPPH